VNASVSGLRTTRQWPSWPRPQLLGRTLGGADRGVRLRAEHHDLRRGGQQPGSARGSASCPRAAGDRCAHVLAQRGQRLGHGGLADAQGAGRAVTEPSLATRTKAFSWVRGHDPTNLRAVRIRGAALHSAAVHAGEPCRFRRMSSTAGGQRGAWRWRCWPVRPERGSWPAATADPDDELRLAQPRGAGRHQRPERIGYLRLDGAELAIGALTRHAELLSSELAAAHFPILTDAEK